MNTIKAKTLNDLRLELVMLQEMYQYLVSSYNEGQTFTPKDQIVGEFIGNKIQSTYVAIGCIVDEYITEVSTQYRDGLLTGVEFINAMQWVAVSEATRSK
jgi:hypothetical protein